MNELYEKIYAAVMTIPRGKVATYAQVAAMVGNPRLCRVVGNALHINPYFGEVPCHRVVNAQGRLSGEFAFGGADIQANMLRAEGVEVVDGRVDLSKYRM
jgi:O-6-methylguanine DNA methyltransferase